MKKTTYIIIAIAVVFLVLMGYLIFLFATNTGTDADENNNKTNSCVELGCSEKDVYAGSKNSDKYYECSCRYAKSINPENIVCFKNDEEALAGNRTKSEC